jgi:hypothetical protein
MRSGIRGNWVFAFGQACPGKKGVSAKQSELQCGISHKYALSSCTASAGPWSRRAASR